MTKEKKGGLLGIRTDNMKKAILGALAALILCAGFVPAHATPDTSAPTLDLFQLSKSSVDTGTEDRSITLTAELSDPSGIRNASFYCNESVWFSLFPGSSSATIYFDSIAAVRTTASVSETGSSTDIRWVVTFTVPENRPASTCNWRWSAQDLAGNRVNELSYTGQTLQVIEGTVPPDTSAPTLDLFQLSKSSVDTGTEDRSITLTAELSDPSGIRNASFYCNESVWFSLFPGSSSATIYFDSIAAVRTTASVSETGSSTDIRWVVTFTVPENRPASTCNWRWSAQDLAGNRVNELSYTGQTLQIIEGTVQDQLVPVEPAIDLSLSPWGSQVGSDSQAATISGSITSIGEVKLFLLKVCDQTLDLGLGGQVTGNPSTFLGPNVRVDWSQYSPPTGNFSLTLVSATSVDKACQVEALLISQTGETWSAELGTTTIPSSKNSAPAPSGVDQYIDHGPDDGEMAIWTKVLAGGNQIKFYVKYPDVGKKIQFMYQADDGNYDQLAWLRVDPGNRLADDGSYDGLQNHVYFIRTFDLRPGKNRVRILVDGELVWGTKTYTLK